MPSLIAPNQTATPREMLMWAVLGILVAALLAAFWTLCNDQVQKARMRDENAQLQRTALSDCLSYMPRSTLHSCAGGGSGVQAAQAQATTVPVNFTFR
ncbi:MAG: hypothetical protein V4787_16545 [Pseudomonadota bacterium]